ncbi:MAG TPA: TIGR03118 family protein, partial [Candidatus Binataceae bacterium]|nr:TIGR03118 family protein [Candidatus Binataceae bacterium]
AMTSLSTYVRTNMVSDNTSVVPAPIEDPRLVNSWGMAFGPTGEFWINDNGSGLSTLYSYDPTTGLVDIIPEPSVVVPPPSNEPGVTAAPTGIVFNNNNAFSSNPQFDGDLFIFDTEDGTLSGWQPSFGNNAALRVDNPQAPNGAVYKGLALGSNNGKMELFATNFRNGTVDVFDVNYNKVTLPKNAFVDQKIPAGYAPFGIANINSTLYVSYALQDGFKHDDVKGPGHGFIDQYMTSGKLIRRFASRGRLDSPWGMVMAPNVGFGIASAHILVGNFGDGGISIFDPATGIWQGFISDSSGDSISPDGLWSLAFGNGAEAGPSTTLFFTSGPNAEADGLFGKIELDSNN